MTTKSEIVNFVVKMKRDAEEATNEVYRLEERAMQAGLNLAELVEERDRVSEYLIKLEDKIANESEREDILIGKAREAQEQENDLLQKVGEIETLFEDWDYVLPKAIYMLETMDDPCLKKTISLLEDVRKDTFEKILSIMS